MLINIYCVVLVSFEGLTIIGEEFGYFKADVENNYVQLKECGLTVSLSKEIIISEDSLYIAICGLWGKELKLPEGTKLVSGVCFISLSPSELINEPYTVHLKHCVHITDENQIKYLSFVTAESSQSPFEFKKIPEGEFCIGSQYGTIKLCKSSLALAIVLVDDKGTWLC